jgi:uncharacterized NAD(P)/FAD-binding protein YdhS
VSGNESCCRTVAIVGGGCSGLLVAVQLLRNGFRGRISVIEPRERLGTGLAYATPFDVHLLNVPVGKMSALAGAPAHFLDWLRERRWPEVHAESFVSRKLYGEYLQELLEYSVVAYACTDFRHIRAEVSDITIRTGVARLALSDGQVIHAEEVVLALGNPASSPAPGAFGDGMETHWHLSPWFGDALKPRFAGEPILVLGTGLTAVDSVLALQSADTSCEIVMLSRRGILPFVHDLRAVAAKTPALNVARSLRSVLRELRVRVEAARESNQCWRGVLDSLRPVSNDLWNDLSRADKARFLRHLKTYWEAHRHRMAPEIHARLDQHRSRGAVRIVGGRIREVRSSGDMATVRILLRQGGEQEFRVNRIINCTGIQENYERAARPLIRSLIVGGLARANELGIGFQTDEHGALLDKEGIPSRVLFTLGPPRRGQLFETTAVPEIRVQAEKLALYLLRSESESRTRSRVLEQTT